MANQLECFVCGREIAHPDQWQECHLLPPKGGSLPPPGGGASRAG